METLTHNAPKLPLRKKKKMSNFEKGISMLCTHFNEESEREMEWFVSDECLTGLQLFLSCCAWILNLLFSHTLSQHKYDSAQVACVA